MKVGEVIIREFKEVDRKRIRDICRNTAQKGNPAATFIEDEEIFVRLMADYYMDYEPELCFVAEVDQRVAGYILGCKDTKKYMKAMLMRILPRLALRALWRVITFQYRQRKTYETLWWFIARSWRELPRPPLDRYPAHCHINIEDGYRHLHLGTRLYYTLISHLRKNGVASMHAYVLEEAGKNVMARTFGTKVLAVNRTTLWEKCTGKRWNVKVLVRDF